MTFIQRVAFIFLLVPLGINASSFNINDTQRMSILSRERLPSHVLYDPHLTPAQENWLKVKKRLLIAVPQPDNPPMDITLRANLYEGVTADIIGLLQQIIGVEVDVKFFSSRTEAINAVKSGEADLIGSSNNYELEEELLLTKKYLSGTPTIYKNFSVKTNEIKRIAVSKYFLPYKELKSIFPSVVIELYPSRYSAVAAVAYGKADAVLIDKISGNFLVNKYHQDTIQLVGSVPVNSSGFSFGVSIHQSILKDILDSAISVIPSINVNSILGRWNGGGLSVQQDSINLTDIERRWLSENNKITIALNKWMPPLSFIDNNGNVHGIASDLIQSIGSKLGVRFDVIPVSSTLEQISALERKNVDLIILSPSEDRKEKYIFSHAFSLEPLVYVVNIKNKKIDPETIIKTGRSALINGFITSLIANDSVGGSNKYYFDRVEEALNCIAEEHCDIAVLPSRIASYFINTYYYDSLYISGELFNSIPVGASFASLPSKNILIGIINKVISSIPAGELDGLSTRWRVSGKKELITWYDLFYEFKEELFVVVVFLFISGVWFLSMRRQIVKRSKAEGALRGQLKFVEELVDSTPNPIYAINNNGVLVLCNQPFSKFVKIDKNILLGESIKTIYDKVTFIEPLLASFNNTIETKMSTNDDHRLVCDGKSIDVYHWQQVYRDLEGEVQGVVGGWIDVSERTALMHDLANASRDAKEASRAKSTFLATMSHEIRTPMNAIIGLLELTLRKGDLCPKDYDSINVAYNSSRDLLSLIGDILDISKIESGKLDLVPAPHNVGELSRSVINVFSAIARQEGLRLDLTCNDEVILMIDAVRYKQILSNLVSNAIKFTREGGIDILLEFSSDSELCDVTLKVKDSGIGISKSDLACLFQPFSQANQPSDIQKSGSGLGLMISRTLSQMMGGDLKIDSELSEGTTVVVTLRLPRVDSDVSLMKQESVASGPDLKSQSVLIIDDHPTNRLLVSQQLDFLGYKVISSSSAGEALIILDTHAADIIITDFNMPDLDGFEFTRRYRQQELDENRKRAIIIGLTADARQEQIKKAIEVGMDDCLFKPVSLDELKICLTIHDISAITITPDVMASRFVGRLKALTMGNSQLINSLLSEFVKASEEDIITLHHACLEADSQTFITQLHRLKGGARIIGADELVTCCSEWEVSPRLPWCMPSALRQVENIYLQVKDGVFFWKKAHNIDS
ncbi:TPA: transporter substrate-binding domain-containing protein [Aeromonas hydrophila]|nr:transporter substrate-binding domain-containing protein [Aeromonas hydrophila]